MKAVELHTISTIVNTLTPRQDSQHFPDDIFKCIILNENVWILVRILLRFVPKDPINNISELIQIMACHRPGDKPLSEPIMVLSTDAYVTQPQWVYTASSQPPKKACAIDNST